MSLEFGQALGGSLESLFGLAERETQMRAAVSGIAVEARAGNGCDADFFHKIFRESHIVGKTKRGNVRHDVISAARLEAAKPGAGENAEQAIAPREYIRSASFS